ncbi:glycosyltransferase family 2 protein [Flagellimonas crocea]|uniref:glycosyltransferase family 2 protein n=1 Tax=Flagellimonas crocea TaxID=3067311 RepID=UPI0029700986|nr:glycosyltransferase [Muricauda sp. DH64]
MKSINPAIVFYCYNRYHHTKKTLGRIIELEENLPLFVFSDGPKDGIMDLNLNQVRDYLKEIKNKKPDIEFVFREKNVGLAGNVIGGINEVFKKGFDSVIVLEDDCVPKEDFFLFMKQALSYYKNNNRVMHISGFGLPLKEKLNSDTYFSPYPCSWGWATWKDCWIKCDFSDESYYWKILNDKELKNQFNWSGKSFSLFLRMQMEGKIDSWLIRWYVHIFKNKGLTVWAANSKLENIGFDGTGKHKVRLDRFNQKHTLTKERFHFEKNIEVSPNIVHEFRRYFMGKNILEKIKSIIYMYSGVILERKKDLSDYYKS